MANMGAQVATQANGTKRRQKVSTQVHAGQLEKVREEVPNSGIDAGLTVFFKSRRYIFETHCR